VIDPNLIMNDFAETSRRLQRKGVSAAEIAVTRDAGKARADLLREVERLRERRNDLSRSIGGLMKDGKKDDAETARSEAASLRTHLDGLEQELRALELRFRDHMLRLPNLPDDAAPDGQDESHNVVRETIGYDPADYSGKTYRPHWEIAEELGIYDLKRASKITGAMFAILRGQGAKLMRALINLAFELNEDKYTEHVVPTFVNSDTFTGTGQLPKFEIDAYRIRDDDLWAIPTGEVPLTGMHRDEILGLEELPKRYMTYTSCFRREAGAAGKDTRGMQRLHEFHKVELVRLCPPEQVQAEFQDLLKDAIRPIALLKLPYRIVDLCTGDLGNSSSRIFDIEVYSPGVDRWLEVSSVGIFTDYQMRRSNIRFRRSDTGRLEFPFALNGSGLATPRVWAAILEHYQQPDGSVLVPEPLRRFMGKDRIVKNP